jgi:2,3-dihydroxyphenylpropionate 1,2-dioxygenase
MGEIVSAGASVHAPQFFTRPPTEVAEQLDAGLAAMRELGCQMLDEPKPDVLIVIGSDHLETFFLSAVPTFAIIAGETIKAAFAGRSYEVPCHPMAEGLLQHLVGAGFDMVYSQDAELGHAFAAMFEWVRGPRDIPVVPIFVNSYLPPLPTARRCQALGKAIADYIGTQPERVAIVASGGMSHYPGTWKYPEPAYDFDHWAIQHLERGDIETLLSLTNRQLDEVGNTELLSWLVMFGAIGARRGELLTYQPTWHHGQAVLRFLPEPPAKPAGEPIPPYQFTGQTNEFYEHPSPATYNLNRLLYDLRHDQELRTRFIANPVAVGEERHLTPRELAVIDTLLDEDIDLLRNLKPHPIVKEGAHALGLLMSLVVVQAEVRRMRRQAQQ